MWWKQVFDFRHLDRAEGTGWRAIMLIHPSSSTVLEVRQHDGDGGEAIESLCTGFDHLGFKVGERRQLEGWRAHFVASASTTRRSPTGASDRS